MKRVIKTAVAVTSFGLAAALAAPVHAEVNDHGVNHAPSDDPIGGLLGGDDGGMGNLLSQLTGGGVLGGLLGGGALPLGGQVDDAEDQAEYMGGPNSYEDITPDSEPRPELGPKVAGLPLGGELLGNLPALGGMVPGGTKPGGASRMAAPGGVKQVQSFQVKAAEQQTLHGAFASVADLVEGSLGGAMAQLSSTSLLPDTTGTTSRTMNGTTQGVGSLSMESTVAGLSEAARHALPAASNGKLAPLIGRVVPAELAPLVEVLPGATQLAAIDEISPLIEDASTVVSANGTKAAGIYADAITSLGWTTAALTSHVTGR
ncbi:hypothetical protein ACIBQX_50170 [Nonomuraea sp. NPDC049714]|uniref:hypothetical protein n=1 Tax=Nonomuraea sp. NPDC049714 TaxID=3364357 RepID=UPI0037AF02E3